MATLHRVDVDGSHACLAQARPAFADSEQLRNALHLLLRDPRLQTVLSVQELLRYWRLLIIVGFCASAEVLNDEVLQEGLALEAVLVRRAEAFLAHAVLETAFEQAALAILP